MRYIVILILFTFTSCMTESKVHRWLDDHEYNAATYCLQKFPVDTISKTEFKYVDSSDYQDAYLRVSDYADTLLWKLDSASSAATPEKPYKPNTDSLRRVIEIELRKRLKPCIDSVVYIKSTVIDHAQETVLKGEIHEKDKLIGDKDTVITGLQKDVKREQKWFWWFLGLVVLIGAYTFLKIRFKIPF